MLSSACGRELLLLLIFNLLVLYLLYQQHNIIIIVPVPTNTKDTVPAATIPAIAPNPRAESNCVKCMVSPIIHVHCIQLHVKELNQRKAPQVLMPQAQYQLSFYVHCVLLHKIKEHNFIVTICLMYVWTPQAYCSHLFSPICVSCLSWITGLTAFATLPAYSVTSNCKKHEWYICTHCDNQTRGIVMSVLWLVWQQY